MPRFLFPCRSHKRCTLSAQTVQIRAEGRQIGYIRCEFPCFAILCDYEGRKVAGLDNLLQLEIDYGEFRNSASGHCDDGINCIGRLSELTHWRFTNTGLADTTYTSARWFGYSWSIASAGATRSADASCGASQWIP